MPESPYCANSNREASFTLSYSSYSYSTHTHTRTLVSNVWSFEKMQRWWNIWWWRWDMEWKRVDCVKKTVKDRRGRADVIPRHFDVMSACAFVFMIICVSMCVSLQPSSARLCGRRSLWGSESSLTLPHNGVFQLARTKNTTVRVCVCNMKTKSSCKESITGLWEVTVSSDDELRDVNKRGLLSS